MATVWMRSKLAKMKPKVEPRYGVRTLAEHGPGNFAPRRLSEPVAPKRPTPRLGTYQAVRACVVYSLDVQSTLIKARG